MIPRQPTGQYGRLIEYVGIEFLVAEARLRRVQRRVGEIDPRRLDEDGCFQTGDLLRKPEVLGERYVSRHLANRSSNSLSRSIN
jgi:hypothetical protein